MGSSGKKKTTMAKLAREHRLRERRLDKQARKDARKQASTEPLNEPDPALAAAEAEPGAPAGAADPGAGDAAPENGDDAVRRFRQVEVEPTDPRATEVALERLRDAPDAELAVFEGNLQDDALEAGASEQEIREAQRDHPGHGA
ncbi:MAG TPA: hypothetical protein VGD00_08445 [Solirubrobacteraceae bacterium]|jgi:hypothetical protein